jgi:CrcB protein
MEQWVWLILGGALGTIGRFGLGGVVAQSMNSVFPYGTIVVNLLGCFAIGIIDTWIQQKMSVDPRVQLFLMAGFCGAFTTFSTFILETGNLLRNGQPFYALANIAISVFGGFLCFWLGLLLAKSL